MKHEQDRTSYETARSTTPPTPARSRTVPTPNWSAGRWTARCRTGLVADAPQTAAATRGGLDGAVFHSDHGARHGSRAFADLCDRFGVTRPMGAVGTGADNAACESFHASPKRETLQGARDCGDADTCGRTVFAWPARYNTRRRYSANFVGFRPRTRTGDPAAKSFLAPVPAVRRRTRAAVAALGSSWVRWSVPLRGQRRAERFWFDPVRPESAER